MRVAVSGRRPILAAAGLAACLALFAGGAAACERRPFGETPIDELLAQHLAEETRWWDQAETVILVRRVQRTRLNLPEGEARRVRLEPIRVLKGAAVDGAFTLEHTHFADCRAMPDWDALSPWRAEEFVVYLRGTEARQDAVLGTRGRREVREPRARDALERLGAE